MEVIVDLSCRKPSSHNKTDAKEKVIGSDRGVLSLTLVSLSRFLRIGQARRICRGSPEHGCDCIRALHQRGNPTDREQGGEEGWTGKEMKTLIVPSCYC